MPWVFLNTSAPQSDRPRADCFTAYLVKTVLTAATDFAITGQFRANSLTFLLVSSIQPNTPDSNCFDFAPAIGVAACIKRANCRISPSLYRAVAYFAHGRAASHGLAGELVD